MKNLKKKDIVAIIFIICALMFAFRHELVGIVSKLFYSNYSLEELAEGQKVADFEKFYSNIIESAPYLDEVKEVYGIDWIERKDYYLDEVKATESNIEFYGVMAAISQDLASFHTDVCFPLYSNLLGLNCYNSRELLHEFGIEAKINAWNDVIRSAFIEYEDVDLFCVKYVSGKYILKEGWLSDTYKHMANYELLTIDGVSAQEYHVRYTCWGKN